MWVSVGHPIIATTFPAISATVFSPFSILCLFQVISFPFPRTDSVPHLLESPPKIVLKPLRTLSTTMRRIMSTLLRSLSHASASSTTGASYNIIVSSDSNVRHHPR